ncbi:MAG: hypothetical protein ABIV28_01655 [Longimicrobiales bacterium]
MSGTSTERLVFDYWPASDAASGAPVRVLILMHGRGASRQDVQGLKGHFPAGWHIVVPEAPHRAAQWGYGPGSAWYRFMGDDRPDAESLSYSLSLLDGLIDELPAIVGSPVDRVVVGGFSQGGTMGNAYALVHQGRAHGVLNFSGFLPSTVSVTAEHVKGIRFFWGHGLQDPSIPFSLAVKGRGVLLAAGAALEARDYGIGHWIDPDELLDASRWLGTI